MIRFAQALIDGTLVGLVYGLIAISFVVIYRASQIVNLAQGEVLLMGALFVWTFTLGAPTIFGFKIPLVVSLLLTAAACVALGLLLERLVFRPLIGQHASAIFMASIALLVMLRGVAQMIWSAETRPFPAILPSGAISLGPFLLNKRLLIGAILTVLLALALHLFLTRTRQGLRLAAVAESHNTALSLGVSVRILSLDVAEIGFKALPVALLGGLESVRGAPLAGLLIGIGEQLAMSYLDPLTNGVASNVLPFGVMIAVLLIRPQGLFGWKKIERL